MVPGRRSRSVSTWWLAAAAIPLAVALMAGCSGGSDPASPTTSATPPVESPTATPTTGADSPAPVGSNDPAALTQADTGRTITLKAGDSVKIQLLNAWLWGEPTVDGGAVTATRVDYLVDPGFTEWTVTAEHSGTATVSVPGTPNCGDNSVCQPRTVTFEFDVTS